MWPTEVTSFKERSNFNFISIVTTAIEVTFAILIITWRGYLPCSLNSLCSIEFNHFLLRQISSSYQKVWIVATAVPNWKKSLEIWSQFTLWNLFLRSTGLKPLVVTKLNLIKRLMDFWELYLKMLRIIIRITWRKVWVGTLRGLT